MLFCVDSVSRHKHLLHMNILISFKNEKHKTTIQTITDKIWNKKKKVFFVFFFYLIANNGPATGGLCIT